MFGTCFALAAAAAGSMDALHLDAGVSSEWYIRTDDKSAGAFYDRLEQPTGLARYEHTLNLKLEARRDGAGLVGDVDMDWLGYGDDRTHTFEDLAERERLWPVRLETHALYLEATNLVVRGMDMRLGSQLAHWGVGDQFNPTNTVNPNNFENVRRFGRQAAVPMARLDYTLPLDGLDVLQDWAVSFVLVPLFRPAILPRSARVGMRRVDRVPFVDEPSRLRLHSEREFAASIGQPTMLAAAQTRLPRARLANMPWALHFGGAIGEHDVGLSYYNGRSDVPQPVLSHTEQDTTSTCDPDNADHCVDGLLRTNVTLAFPRMQVLGLNVAGEAPLRLGYRLEVGVYLPTPVRTKITSGDVTLLGLEQPAGEYAYATPDGLAPLVVEDRAFAKWTVGLDYTVGPHLYVNAMWVHGLPDEYGAGDFLHTGWSIRSATATPGASLLVCALGQNGESCIDEIKRPRLGDYLVLGTDFRFANNRALLRLFSVVDLSGYTRDTWDASAETRVSETLGAFSQEGFSMTLYPELAYAFGNGLSLSTGAILLLGDEYTRFGDPAAGGSLVFVSGSYQP